jgi:hypothetical protein
VDPEPEMITDDQIRGYAVRLRSSASGKAEAAEYLDSEIDKIIGPIYELLGEEILLIPDDLGTKCPRYGIRSVAHTLTKDNLTGYYVEKLKESILEDGNLAVKLGPDSGNIVTIDFDYDSVIDPFLSVNERLKNTLRTTGSGVSCNLWFRLAGYYVPETVVVHVTERLAKKYGVRANRITGTYDIGEYRKGGGQKTTIFGKHSSGKRYKWLVEEPVVTIPAEEVFFLTGWNWRSRTAEEIEAAKKDRALTEEDLINETADRRKNRKFHTGGSH